MSLLLAVLVTVGVWQGFTAHRKLTHQKRVAAACDAAAAERWEQALSLSEGIVGEDADGQIAAGCRCTALISLGRTPECVDLVSSIVGRSSSAGWEPPASLLRVAIRERIDEGRFDDARSLVRWGRDTYPDHLGLLEDEIKVRLSLEDAASVLAEYERALTETPASVGLRLLLATVYAQRGDFVSELRVVGETWPPRDHPLFEPWFHKRVHAQAELSDIEGVKRSFAKMREIVGESAELDAHYALRLDTSGLSDPDHDVGDLMKSALARKDEIHNPELVGWLVQRLISYLLVSGRAEEALSYYDEAEGHFPLGAITRGQIQRSIAQAAAGDAKSGGRTDVVGTLSFTIPDAEQGDRLLLSDNATREPDEPFEVVPGLRANNKEVTVERRLALWPERWVLVDAQDRVRASGSVWPKSGSDVRIEVIRGNAAAKLPAYEAEPRPVGDGRQRVVAIVLDCADWRLTQYLRMRGELPFMDYAFQHGRRAVMLSDPPLTGAAMSTLIWPERADQVSFLGLMHRLGLEIGGLESVGVNPFGFLEGALPASPNLFETLGSGNKIVANMLFSHGEIDAGEQAEVIGPLGRKRKLHMTDLFRPLTPEELEHLPLVRRDQKIRRLSEAIAGEFDTALQIIRGQEIDLLFLRIESLDILTHTLFGELVETRQDDGKAGLLDTYRYIDGRLAQVFAALDSDDVLIVMSDHGIRTAMQHESDAIFVALAQGTPPGRAEGRPPLVGVSQVLASFLGIRTDWPDTGIAAPHGLARRMPEADDGAPNGI